LEVSFYWSLKRNYNNGLAMQNEQTEQDTEKGDGIKI
jgi:hypothetical protein